MSIVWHGRANGGGRRRDFDAELSNTSPRNAYPRISETIIRGAAHDSLDTKLCPLDPALTLLGRRRTSRRRRTVSVNGITVLYQQTAQESLRVLGLLALQHPTATRTCSCAVAVRSDSEVGGWSAGAARADHAQPCGESMYATGAPSPRPTGSKRGPERRRPSAPSDLYGRCRPANQPPRAVAGAPPRRHRAEGRAP